MARKSVSLQNIFINNYPDQNRFKGKRTVMVAVDESEGAMKSLDYAVENILNPGDTVILVQALKKHRTALFESPEAAKGHEKKMVDKAVFNIKKYLVKVEKV